MERLSRIELAFGGGMLTGAQATLETGVEIDGAFVRTGERTTGLDPGGSPEYATALVTVLGDALTAALAANAALAAQLEAAQAEV